MDNKTKQEPNEGRLFNVARAAEWLGISQHTVRRYILERRIPFMKIGDAIRFDPSELDDWIDSRRVPAAK